jgi:hypothetical protein
MVRNAGVVCTVLLVACASTPEQAAPAAEPEKKPVWSMATETETAAALDKKVQEAAKGYVKLKKDGVLLFCKKRKEIGSNIATIQCITEAQLRNQVETMEDYRQRRRDAAKCTHGVGCSAGF